jgi:hypothetical protein
MKSRARRSPKLDCQGRTSLICALNNNSFDGRSENSVRETVDAKLIGFGLEKGDGKELRADLRHMRSLRKRAEQVYGFILKGIITCALTCFMGAAWIGLKAAIGR